MLALIVWSIMCVVLGVVFGSLIVGLAAAGLRVGSRVGTSRMDFCGPDGTLMSAGAAAYIVS